MKMPTYLEVGYGCGQLVRKIPACRRRHRLGRGIICSLGSASLEVGIMAMTDPQTFIYNKYLGYEQLWCFRDRRIKGTPSLMLADRLISIHAEVNQSIYREDTM